MVRRLALYTEKPSHSEVAVVAQSRQAAKKKEEDPNDILAEPPKESRHEMKRPKVRFHCGGRSGLKGLLFLCWMELCFPPHSLLLKLI